MEWAGFLIVALAAFLAAGLTMYSGFGLGTLMLPVFALFLPVEMAVVATALVHGANNVFKVSLVGKYADWGTVLRFGLPALLAAVLGAALLGWFAARPPLFSYEIGPIAAEVRPIKLVMGLLMMFFAAFELAPSLRQFRFQRDHLPVRRCMIADTPMHLARPVKFGLGGAFTREMPKRLVQWPADAIST